MTTTMGTATFKIASTRRLADRSALRARDHLDDAPAREFIEGADMFFLATCDHRGLPTCSYKGGDGVRAGARCVVAGLSQSYDGNRKYQSMGNLRQNPHLRMLFLDFEHGRRLRLQGMASIDEEDELLAAYPGAQFIVRVQVTEVYDNCPRYIHEYQLVERSAYVPRCDREPPIPNEAAPRGA